MKGVSCLLTFLAVQNAYSSQDDLLGVASKLVSAVQDGMHESNWFHYRNFGSWSYEGAVITRGLWELQSVLPELSLEEFLNNHLDRFMDDPQEFGYRILHNESLTYNDSSVILPWLYSIGDNIGLFPIVYADRNKYGSTPGGHSAEDDLYIVKEVVDKYIYGYPWHLPDGTISRPMTWLAEGFFDLRGGGVWVDDMYMGTALLVDHAKLSGDIKHLEYAGTQLINIFAILQESYTGLMKHGYHYWTDHHSCCYWGRGNGWAIVALSEFLEAAQEMELDVSNAEMFDRVLDDYNALLLGLLDKRDEAGLWHNILTNNSTFMETSASAMFLTALARGYRQGWIYVDEDYTETIRSTWAAVLNNIQQDGTITNIIGGTGIQNGESDYAPASTEYNKASPGVGAVLRATAEMVKFEKWSNQRR